MGWASGSELAAGVWDIVLSCMDTRTGEVKRIAIARQIVRLFEAYDCDTLDEAEDLMKAAYPKGRRYR